MTFDLYFFVRPPAIVYHRADLQGVSGITIAPLEHTSNYWLDLFTLETWEETGQYGFTVSGFRRSGWPTVQKIKPSDVLICYLTKALRFVGALKVISEPYLDETPIWKSDVFPCRFRVEPVIGLSPANKRPTSCRCSPPSFSGLS